MSSSRVRATSPSIRASRSSTRSKRSMSRSRAMNSTATWSPYRSPSKSSRYASTPALPALERGIRPDRDRRGRAHGLGPGQVLRLATTDQPSGVDAVRGDGRVRHRFDVGGREADRPAPAVAAHDHSLHPVRAAHRGGGGADVPTRHARPHIGGRNRKIAFAQQRDAFGREAEHASLALQSRQIAGGPMAVAEVLPDDHRAGMQRLDEHLVDEGVGAQAAEVERERDHAHHVDAHPVQELGLVPLRREHRWVAAGTDHLAGMRIEGHHDRRLAGPARALDSAADDLLMAPVDAVEHADGHDTQAPRRGHTLDPAPPQHAPEPNAEPGSILRASGPPACRSRSRVARDQRRTTSPVRFRRTCRTDKSDVR